MSGRIPAGRSATATGLVLLLFASAALVGLLSHEMWRDECEIWLIARDSGSLPELFANMSTQGHPALWYVLNFVLTRFTHDPLAMQLLNLAIGTAAALIWLVYAPFPTAQRVLFCLGYYALYEFTVISRSYALELLLVFVVCALYARRRRLGAAATVALVLLANTNLYGTIIAAHVVLLAFLVSVEHRGIAQSLRHARTVVPLIVVSAGVAVGIMHTLAQALAIGPDHAGAYSPGWDLEWCLRGLRTVATGFLPLSDPTAFHSWNSTFLSALPGSSGVGAGAALGLVLLGLCAWYLRRRAALLTVFLLGAANMLGITFFVWYGSMRHHGQLFVWFVICCWLSRAIGDARSHAETAEPESAPARTRGRFDQVLTVILVVQTLAAAHALSRDAIHPFSNAEATGRYLEREDLGRTPLVGSIDYAVQPITAFMDRPIYYPESRRYGTFMDWSERRHMVSPERALTEAVALLEGESREVVMVLNYPPRLALGQTLPLGDRVQMTYVKRFVGALVPDENYHLYRLTRTD